MIVVIFSVVLSSALNMLAASEVTFIDDRSVYANEAICLRNDQTDASDQPQKQQGLELIDHLLSSFAGNAYDNKDKHTDNCSTQIMDAVDDLELIANDLSGNVSLNDFTWGSFSKVFDSLLRSSSIGVLISIVAVGLVLNFLNKLNKSTNRIRKGFSQGTRKRILIKQNYRCSYCRRVLKVIDYHHKNGDRSDNRENNCQALCPNCHALRTRNKLVKY